MWINRWDLWGAYALRTDLGAVPEVRPVNKACVATCAAEHTLVAAECVSSRDGELHLQRHAERQSRSGFEPLRLEELVPQCGRCDPTPFAACGLSNPGSFDQRSLDGRRLHPMEGEKSAAAELGGRRTRVFNFQPLFHESGSPGSSFGFAQLPDHLEELSAVVGLGKPRKVAVLLGHALRSVAAQEEKGYFPLRKGLGHRIAHFTP